MLLHITGLYAEFYSAGFYCQHKKITWPVLASMTLLDDFHILACIGNA